MWNPNIGYGVVSAVKAIQADSTIGWREPNNIRANASAFPLGKEVVGDWGSLSDGNWYSIEVPYDGTFSLLGDEARLVMYSAKGLVESTAATPPQTGVLKQWKLQKGSYWLHVLRPTTVVQLGDGYRLVSQFTMSPDAFEPNDSAASAYTLPPRSQQWTGTFHKRGDVDWFVVTLPKPGILRLSVTTDTTRIDPELWIQPAGGPAVIVDERGDGGNEQWETNKAQAGKYYIRISNAVSTNPEAVIGTYTAALEYIAEKEDFLRA